MFAASNPATNRPCVLPSWQGRGRAYSLARRVRRGKGSDEKGRNIFRFRASVKSEIRKVSVKGSGLTRDLGLGLSGSRVWSLWL